MIKEQPIVFSKQWFGKHQNKLLFLLNNKFTRVLFRKIMRIDCKKDILALLPNSYIIKGSKKDEYIADFRTHDKYAKRLYYAFKPFWYVIHIWDTLFANKWIPGFNLGFDTLTVYPDAGTGGTTVDGYVERNAISENWATIHDGNGTAYNATITDAKYAQFITGGGANWNFITRSIFTLDTSALTLSSVISNAIFYLYGSGKVGDVFTANLSICSSSPDANNNLSASDYQNLGTIEFSSIKYSSWSTSGYNGFTLNSSGISNISKTGISKFGARIYNDLVNSNPGLLYNAFLQYKGYYADQTGTNNDPKLVVTYTLATFIPQILFM